MSNAIDVKVGLNSSIPQKTFLSDRKTKGDGRVRPQVEVPQLINKALDSTAQQSLISVQFLTESAAVVGKMSKQREDGGM